MMVSVMTEDIAFDTKSMPVDLYRFMRQWKGHYLPILYIDELSNRIKDLWVSSITLNNWEIEVLRDYPIGENSLML